MKLEEKIINKDISTIAAIATPQGYGGIGMIRVSGPNVFCVIQNICPHVKKSRFAYMVSIKDKFGEIIDNGIAIFFKSPNSFTGEDVLELQMHGSPIGLQRILHVLLQNGCSQAEPGEFSKRAFLNGKLDLTQAEAIADFISASSVHASRAAQRSLCGAFSKRIEQLLQQLIHVRMLVESAIDFPEEKIDFVKDETLFNAIKALLIAIRILLNEAETGLVLNNGLKTVILGKPNVGKSSLLNHLAAQDIAIVTDIPGTTRDILQVQINLNGLLLNVLDTAGLRETCEKIEKEGITRALKHAYEADLLLIVIDISQDNLQTIYQWLEAQKIPPNIPYLFVLNKIDLLKDATIAYQNIEHPFVLVSAKTGKGFDGFSETIKRIFGLRDLDGALSARRRHVEILKKISKNLHEAFEAFEENRASELLAEDLRESQDLLSQITGKFHADDLLGEIFSEFCIGK